MLPAVGGSVGGCVVVLMIGASGFFMRRRWKRDSNPDTVGSLHAVQPLPVVVKPSSDDSLSLPLQNKKTYHYYISHHAMHSKLGSQPLLVVTAFHDIFACNGFIGYFEPDDTIHLSDTEQLELIRGSSCMVIFLHDETIQSQICQQEWSLATKLKIPVIVVSDANFDIRSLKLQMVEINSNLSNLHWVKYLDSFRHDCYKQVVAWLNKSCNTVGSFQSMAIEVPSVERGKKYHYFVSHKKSHRTLGKQPEALAMAFHDVLKMKGYIGFFDVDDLKTISVEELTRSVMASCTVIIFLNDETTTSEWCRLEWKVAEENDIPVLCIFDSANCSKEKVLAQVAEVNGHLLKEQWLNYLDTWRHKTQHATWNWLDKQLSESIRMRGVATQAHQLKRDFEAVLPGRPSVSEC